jgi:DNA-binding SARP family transcriptional activator
VNKAPSVGPTNLSVDMNSATLCLLGGPVMIKNGRRLEIPEGSKRLLVFVTLHGGRVSRRHAAGTLWPCVDDERAAGNLRSALWRLRGADIDVLHADKCLLYLDPEASVDITQLSRWATRVINGSANSSDLGTRELHPEAVHLLPGWYDEWVIFERERLRQRLLHAMESLVRQQISRGLLADAIEVATTAVGVEPLRESAQRVLIEAHLAEGNLVEARRAYIAYHEMLAAELGVSPSIELIEIVSRHAGISRPRPQDGGAPSLMPPLVELVAAGRSGSIPSRQASTLARDQSKHHGLSPKKQRHSRRTQGVSRRIQLNATSTRSPG